MIETFYSIDELRKRLRELEASRLALYDYAYDRAWELIFREKQIKQELEQ